MIPCSCSFSFLTLVQQKHFNLLYEEIHATRSARLNFPSPKENVQGSNSSELCKFYWAINCKINLRKKKKKEKSAPLWTLNFTSFTFIRLSLGHICLLCKVNVTDVGLPFGYLWIIHGTSFQLPRLSLPISVSWMSRKEAITSKAEAPKCKPLSLLGLPIYRKMKKAIQPLAVNLLVS